MSPLLTLVPRGWGFCSVEMCLAALGLRGKKLISPVGALSTSLLCSPGRLVCLEYFRRETGRL